jgi:hypothetical protein
VLRLATPIVALTLGAGAAFALASCGEDDATGLLPGETAEQIQANLDEVERLAEAGDCGGAQAAVDDVQVQIDNLGSEVDGRLQEALADGAEQLEDVTVAECEEAAAPTPPPPPEEPTTTDTTTTDDDEEEEEEEPEENGEETTLQPPPPPPTPEPPAPPPPPTPEPPAPPAPPSNGGGIGPGATP